MADCCEHGNELSCSIKIGNFVKNSANKGLGRRTMLHGLIYIFILLSSTNRPTTLISHMCLLLEKGI
jgi:hypothetical protein